MFSGSLDLRNEVPASNTASYTMSANMRFLHSAFVTDNAMRLMLRLGI